MPADIWRPPKHTNQMKIEYMLVYIMYFHVGKEKNVFVYLQMYAWKCSKRMQWKADTAAPMPCPPTICWRSSLWAPLSPVLLQPTSSPSAPVDNPPPTAADPCPCPEIHC